MNVLLAIGVLVFLACGNDDDDDNEAQQDCRICSFGLIVGEEVTAEYCDNGDGTITITANGEETTETLDGASFSEFINAFELLGATCN